MFSKSVVILLFIISSEPPVLLPINFGSDVFMEGDLVQSNCVLQKGDKPAVMSWLFNNQLITNTNDDINIANLGSRTSILTIDSVKGYNQGNFSCVASNLAGTYAVHSTLIVQGLFLIIFFYILWILNLLMFGVYSLLNFNISFSNIIRTGRNNIHMVSTNIFYC